MIVSLTPFFNEYEILELRLATLDGVVDHHVVGHSRVTHSGKPNSHTDLRRLAETVEPWRHKVSVVDCTPDAYTQYGREKGQRRLLAKGLPDGVGDDDKLLLSDLDEIPHPLCVQHGDYHVLPCRMHVAKLNWRWVKEPTVHHQIARIFPASYLMDGGNLEEARLQSMPLLDGPHGWHLSWMQDIETKLESFVDEGMVTFARPDLALRGGNLFPGCGTDADHGIEWVDLDQLPPYVAANPDKFTHLTVEAP